MTNLHNAYKQGRPAQKRWTAFLFKTVSRLAPDLTR
jgi:hypothetical protein